MVDLGERARELLAAMEGLGGSRLLGFFDERAELEYPGTLGPFGRESLASFLDTVRRNLEAMRVRDLRFHAERVIVQGDTTTIEWLCTSTRGGGGSGESRGVSIVTWTLEGKVLRLAIYADPAMVRKYAVGWMSGQAEAAAGAWGP